ncbi:MAG: adenosine deaminase [Deltaproteobacteria bacterium]|nr:MAG: adenosine deaminase [Deltaproteobacteria bacterium]RLC17772.1 MAG: adenosine deaminase [Deltaproteobacteria bacterium]
MEAFIHGIPKAELHVHIEGTLGPELMMKLAAKNGIALPFESAADIRRAYDFKDLQSFLDIYYQGAQVLLTVDDFYRLTWNYLQKASEQNVRHAEIFFDPQTHTARGIKFETIVQGIHRAMVDAGHQLGLSSKLIMCILRHLSVAEAMDTLEKAQDFKDIIAAVGLDSVELGFPPEKFVTVFDRARQWGFKTVAHAGEEGPPDYIWQALKLLHVERIDHGIRCLEDAGLVEYLVREHVPLTVCPMSNVKLKVFDHMKQHNLKKMLELGLCVTVNSDDPAYFDGYIEENFLALHHALELNFSDISKLARNAFKASFLNPIEKKKYLNELDEFVSSI